MATLLGKLRHHKNLTPPKSLGTPRTPRINATAGRDHWAPCYTQLLAGGGVRGGQIYGASDSIGAYVKDLPVTPDDYMATILHAFGYAPESAVYDQLNRPQRISLGTPVTALF